MLVGRTQLLADSRWSLIMAGSCQGLSWWLVVTGGGWYLSSYFWVAYYHQQLPYCFLMAGGICWLLGTFKLLPEV